MFSNRTIVPATRVDKQVGRLGLDVTLAILLAATTLSLPGAAGIHIAGGSLLVIGCGIHLIMHGRWIKAVILDEPKSVTLALRHQRRLFWGMFLSGSLCGLSGLAMLPLTLDFHAFLLLHCCGTPIHILSGLSFSGLTIYHLVLHRNWFTARLGRVSTAVRK